MLDGRTDQAAHLALPRNPDICRALQELLAAAGDYKGRIDGTWGPSSRDAAKAYYSRGS